MFFITKKTISEIFDFAENQAKKDIDNRKIYFEEYFDNFGEVLQYLSKIKKVIDSSEVKLNKTNLEDEIANYKNKSK